MKYQVNVKWGKHVYENVVLDMDQSVHSFKERVSGLTGILPERQKMMYKGGMMKENVQEWGEDLKKCIHDGMALMVMGSVEPLPSQESMERQLKLEKEEAIALAKLKRSQEGRDGEEDDLSGGEGMIPAPIGLMNLGNTCYLNASLQCLRAMPELREALIKYTVPIPNQVASSLSMRGGGSLDMMEEKTKKVNVALRELFHLMDKKHIASIAKEGEEETEEEAGTTRRDPTLSRSLRGIPPLFLLQFFREAYPQFSLQDSQGHFMQQDAEECWGYLLTCLDQLPSLITSQTSSTSTSTFSSFVKEFMTGELVSQWTCSEAPEEPPTETHETFTRLSCHISKDVNFLMQGLKERFHEKIEKNSPTLQRMSTYTKISKITQLPVYLTIHFVRFYWKSTDATKAKILRKVNFPFELDTFELCSESLQKTLLPHRETHQPLNGRYELYAVLTHMGRSADSGHYIAWVRRDRTPTSANTTTSSSTSSSWWKYDDDQVSLVQRDDIMKLEGGGDWHIAYLCLYRRQ